MRRALIFAWLLLAVIAGGNAAQAQFGQFTQGAAAAAGPVVFDAATTTPATGTASNTISLTTFTVGSGSKRYLVAGICWNPQANSISSLAWDPSGTNQALTQITTVNVSGAVGRCELWGLVAPTSGNKTLTATFSSSTTQVVMGAISFTGVNQTGNASPSTVVPATPVSGAGASPSITITSGTTHLTVSGGADSDSTSATNKTQAWLNISGAVGGFADYTTTGASSSTHTWSATSANYGLVGIDILP